MNFSSFPLGPFVISTGGFFVFLGTLASCLVLIQTIRDEKVSLQFLSDHLMFFVFFPILLGRLGAFFSIFPILKTDFQMAENFWQKVIIFLKNFLIFGPSGISIDWMLGGIFLTFLVISFWRKENFFSWLDAFSLPGITIAFFVSIGGFFSAWNYGAPIPENFPHFFPFSVSYNLQEVRYSEPVYAVQIYSAIIFLFIFLIEWNLWKRKIFRLWAPGKFFAVTLFFFGFSNFFLEFFRGDSVPIFFGFRFSQILNFLITISAVVFWIIRQKSFSFLAEKNRQRFNLKNRF